MADRTDAVPPDADEATLHRRWAVELFNDVWRLLETEDRTADEDAQMVHQAHASLYHWLQCGTANNAARGEWQCSRVYSVLHRSEPAVYHANRVVDICRRNGIGDWDLAFGYEALARANLVAGNTDEARRWFDHAQLAGEHIAEDEDRELLRADLATIALAPPSD